MNNSTGFIGGCLSVCLAIFIAIGSLLCIERIPTGHVGVVYSMRGGVEDEVLQQGFHFVSPTKKVREFSIGNEQLVMSQDKREGSDENESFYVATSDNANIKISFQMSYRFAAGKVVDTFKNFKGMDGDSIVDNRVKTVLKAEVSEVTSEYSIMELYSGSRASVNDKLTQYLADKFLDKYGIEVMDASIIDVHPSKQLKKSINARVKATQDKQQAKLEQETAKVKAETKLIEAKNKAQIKVENAKAEAEANSLKQKTLTEAMLKEQWIEKWDGKLPTVSSSGSNLYYGIK